MHHSAVCADRYLIYAVLCHALFIAYGLYHLVDGSDYRLLQLVRSVLRILDLVGYPRENVESEELLGIYL